MAQYTPEDIDNEILAQYAPQLEGRGRTRGSTKNISRQLALQKLDLYEEQEENSSSAFIYELDKH